MGCVAATATGSAAAGRSPAFDRPRAPRPPGAPEPADRRRPEGAGDSLVRQGLPRPRPSARGIIVLNNNFVPASAAGPFKYGAVGYALRVAEALHRRGLLAGFLLYRRDEGLDRPRLDPVPLLGYPALRLGFHFGMGAEVLGPALEAARGRLGGGRLYYQTNVLLPFHPPGRPLVVTHHAPFVDHVVEVMGPRLAAEAFGAGRAKLEHLRDSQRLGLQHLARRRGAAVEISSIQADYLRAHGVEGRCIHRIHPPLESSAANGLSGEGARLRGFIAAGGPRLVLCTACSRLDAFKNVELLVEAALRLLRSGLDLRVLIIGGPPRDGERQRLERRVDKPLAHRFRFAPRVPRDDLAQLLDALAGRGLFVCPSRYETCGLTPLEAAARGVCTLVTDTPDRVEAASLVPPAQRFTPTVEGLAAAVRRLTAVGVLPAGDRVLDEGARAGSLAFDARFIDTWRRLTAPHAAGRGDRADSGRPVHSPEPVHPA